MEHWGVFFLSFTLCTATTLSKGGGGPARYKTLKGRSFMRGYPSAKHEQIGIIGEL